MKHAILFLAANPIEASRLALEREARAIQVELERSGSRDRFEFVTRWAVEPLDLLRELRKLRPTIVHFSGHGAYGAKTSPEANPTQNRDLSGDRHEGLIFHGADGRPQIVSAMAFRDAFGAVSSAVKLVVLNACYSEAAAEVLLAHVDCVIGMAGSVLDSTARTFAIGLYGGLGERESIAAAYKGGCAAIGLEGLPESDRPRLKVRVGADAEALKIDDRDVDRGAVIGTPQHKHTVSRALFVPLLVAALAGAAVALSFYLAPVPAQQFEVTVFLHGESEPQALALRSGSKLTLDLGSDRRSESVGDKGEVRFPGIPVGMRGRDVAMMLSDDKYELSDSSPSIRLSQEVFYAAVRAKRLPLVGYVSDTRGRPLAGARASIAGNSATAGLDGRFEIMLPVDLPESDRTITIVASGYDTWRGQAVPGGNALQLHLSAIERKK